MLCQFSFQNFRSYKSETTFDLQATAIPEFADTLISGNKAGDLLPVGVIYGPNGGGKSNLLNALAYLITVVVKPIYLMDKTRVRMIYPQWANCKPFLFDGDSKNQPTSFEIYFRKNKNEYRYYLSILNEEIVMESLHWRTIGGKKTGTVFEREQSNITLGASIAKNGINRAVNPKMPYLTFLAITYDIPIIVEVQTWFESCIVRRYGNSDIEKLVMFSSDQTAQQTVIRALNDMGIDITGYRYDENEKKIYTQRTVNGMTYEMQFEDESDGTQKMIGMLPAILVALHEGSLVIVDELDAKLHPKLLRYIIGLFKNKNINIHGGQLLFTSQDMTTMKNTVFRRDEIWFAALNENHESEIYSLYEIRREDNERVNSTAAFDKQYLEGRYGADPYLSNMLAEENWT